MIQSTPARNDRLQQRRSENTIFDADFDFYSKYYAVYHLQNLSKSSPETVTSRTVRALDHLIDQHRHSSRRQDYFLCRETADTLKSIAIRSTNFEVVDLAFTVLMNALASTTGHIHRAVAEKIGELPVCIRAPSIDDPCQKHVSQIVWNHLLDQKVNGSNRRIRYAGRSVLVHIDAKEQILVFKLARKNESFEGLIIEALWMEYLNRQRHLFQMRFDIPRPIKMDHGYLFRIRGLPREIIKKANLHPKRYSIGFFAHKAYFHYPNDGNDKKNLNHGTFKEVITRNAWLLGRMAGTGIIHSAPIPLFHNRIQRFRRNDQGVYQWFRAGRLDRWLDSCLYPNIGVSGIRDFEHLVAFDGHGRQLYRHIGNHFIALFLLAGSYFRCKDSGRIGYSDHQQPVDTRDLFDRILLREMIEQVFVSYYDGFCNTPFIDTIPVDIDKFTDRMIDEMGVDRYMEETIRVHDQHEMTNRQFRELLTDGGYTAAQAGNIEKGCRDIVILTGPHLGAFNQGISLPELIETVETMSALCIFGKYRVQKGVETN